MIRTKWTTSWANLFMTYANNKGADQPAHPRSLIWQRFCCSLLRHYNIYTCYIQNFNSVAEQAGLSLTWSQTPKTGFLVMWLSLSLSFQKVTGNDASENATGFVNLLLVALAAFSTAYNIILYVLFNPSFKRAIKDMLCCRKSSTLLEKHRSDGVTVHTMAYPFEE